MPSRGPFGRRSKPDPKQPHAFVETNDPGLGPVSAGTSYAGNQANIFGMTTAYLRSTRCAVPGCARERHDPVHTLAEG